MTILEPSTPAAVALDVLMCSSLGPRDIARRQQGRLARTLAHAELHSAFYRRRWRGIDIRRAPLADLPVMNKPDLMAHFDTWVTDPAVSLEAVSRFLADPAQAGLPFLDRYMVWESSGTSGEPAIYLQDEHAMAVYDALEAERRNTPRPIQRLLDPWLLGERFAFVGATGGHFASDVSLQRVVRMAPWLAGRWRSFSILQPTGLLLAQLQDFAPTIVATYPTAAGMLADEAARGALHIAPREVWTGGETLGPAVRRHIQAVFGCAVRNSYGASEFLPIAWECGHSQLHVNSDWVILEPVDAAGRPAEPGALSHTTLLTNLANTVQPLVRFDLGDQVKWVPGPCVCGSPLPVIEVMGRADDVMHLPGRDGAPVTLLPLALTTVLESAAGAFDFELRQTAPQTLHLHLGRAAAPARKACLAALHAFADAQGLAPLRVGVSIGGLAARGRSGKVRRIVALPGVAAPRSAKSGAASRRHGGKSRA